MTALIVVVVAAVLALPVLVKLGTKKVACPSCDLYIHGVRLGGDGAVLCPHCRAYATVAGGALVATPADRVAARPVFCCELPDRVAWPDGCCVCAAPATRGVPVKLVETADASLHRALATRVATLGMFKAVERHTWTLDEAHADGAALSAPAEAEQVNPGIAFRSFAYDTRFVAANRVTPRRDSDAGG